MGIESRARSCRERSLSAMQLALLEAGLARVDYVQARNLDALERPDRGGGHRRGYGCGAPALASSSRER